MIKLKYRWFDNVRWSWMEGEVIAESKECAEAFIREKYNVNRRPYYDSDSIIVLEESEVTIPCFTSEPKELREL
jgi:viroplasmin and RNaseH domain-containing protein